MNYIIFVRQSNCHNGLVASLFTSCISNAQIILLQGTTTHTNTQTTKIAGTLNMMRIPIFNQERFTSLKIGDKFYLFLKIRRDRNSRNNDINVILIQAMQQ